MPIDTSRPPAPPAKRTAKTPARPAPVILDKTAARREALTGLGQITASILIMRGGYADAGAIAQHGPAVARETALLAEQNERIASVVDYLTEAGPYMGLITAVLPLALQFAANHNRLDANKLSPDFGVFPPDILEKRVKKEMEARRAEMNRAAETAPSPNGHGA